MFSTVLPLLLLRSLVEIAQLLLHRGGRETAQHRQTALGLAGPSPGQQPDRRVWPVQGRYLSSIMSVYRVGDRL